MTLTTRAFIVVANWRYGTVLQWEYDPEDDEPFGRFLVVAPDQPLRGRTYIKVLCVVAAPNTEWRVGDIVPVRRDDLRVARE